MDASPEDGASDTGQRDTGFRDSGHDDAGRVDAHTDSSLGDAGSCEVSPCRLVSPQCGCESGLACYWSGGPGCDPPGTYPVGSLCTVNQDCETGAGCIKGAGDPTGVCRPYCLDPSTCGPEERCVRLGPTGGVAGACETVCDPITQDGCPTSLQCVLTNTPVEPSGDRTVVTGCAAPGTATVGASCGFGVECEPGAACDSAASICRTICDAAGGTACPGGVVCIPVGLVRAGHSYGICRD